MQTIDQLQNYLRENQFSQIFILTDENSGKYCLPILLEKADEIADRGATLLEIPAGEENKNIETIKNLSSSLLESNADRNSLLISLGGGVVTDVGGFVASIYKRGIQNINIPTTLLAMVDASIGGKTGVNLNGIKNALGTFNTDTITLVDTDFLQTLPYKEILSGVGEMLKTFLVLDKEMLAKFISKKDLQTIEDEFILRCMELKESVVEQDVFDNKRRKILNFGHTLGHAFEGYYSLLEKKSITHGEAVVIGIYYAMKL
ncbi:MAG: 3-dehydroquinate synthase family protein, partial [Bacteroidota bacterium]|nr:3-dehydroquinate synthase family protein [Bacteroidota bacterium]